MVNKTLQAAICGPDGALVDVTKIEVEILDGGRCRWNLFDGSRRLYSAVAQPSDVPGMLEASRMILEAMGGSMHDSEPRWIPVDEALPPERYLVLVWLEGLFLPFVGYIRVHSGGPFFVTPRFRTDSAWKARPRVTHWMDCIPGQTERYRGRWNFIRPNDGRVPCRDL